MGIEGNIYNILENGAGKFKLEIPGAPVASANVESISVEDLTIDIREVTTGADWDYRIYAPGDAHYGNVTIKSRVGAQSKELYTWFEDCSKGKNIRKDVAVILLNRDGSEARRWNLFRCFPIRWDSGDYSPTSSVQCETVVCKMGRIEI